jgi:hypothetical protein
VTRLHVRPQQLPHVQHAVRRHALQNSTVGRHLKRLVSTMRAEQPGLQNCYDWLLQPRYQHSVTSISAPLSHRCPHSTGVFCPVRVLSFFPPSLGAHRAWEKKTYLECHLGFIRGEDRHVDDAGHNCRKPTCLSVLCVLFFFAREKLGTGLKRGGIRLRSCEPRDPTARGTHLLQRKNRGGRVVCSLSDTVQYCFPP